jgi:hypothetical protein
MEPKSKKQRERERRAKARAYYRKNGETFAQSAKRRRVVVSTFNEEGDIFAKRNVL